MQAEYERKANPNDRGQQALLEEMRAHVKKAWTWLAVHDKLSQLGAQVMHDNPLQLLSLKRHRLCDMQLEEMRKNEDPRLSFSTPEFKEAQRIFTDNFKV